jgi:hypothetical protein
VTRPPPTPTAPTGMRRRFRPPSTFDLGGPGIAVFDAGLDRVAASEATVVRSLFVVVANAATIRSPRSLRLVRPINARNQSFTSRRFVLQEDRSAPRHPGEPSSTVAPMRDGSSRSSEPSWQRGPPSMQRCAPQPVRPHVAIAPLTGTMRPHPPGTR